MRVDYAFVAESADSQAGLFYVNRGGTDLFFIPSHFPKPIHLPAVSFVVRVVGEPHETGQPFTLTYTVVDQDGRSTGFRQNVDVSFEPHPIDPTLTTASIATFRFYGFPVPDFGTYLFEVRLGEERLAQVPFWVVPMATPGEPEAPPSSPSMPAE